MALFGAFFLKERDVAYARVAWISVLNVSWRASNWSKAGECVDGVNGFGTCMALIFKWNWVIDRRPRQMTESSTWSMPALSISVDWESEVCCSPMMQVSKDIRRIWNSILSHITEMMILAASPLIQTLLDGYISSLNAASLTWTVLCWLSKFASTLSKTAVICMLTSEIMVAVKPSHSGYDVFFRWFAWPWKCVLRFPSFYKRFGMCFLGLLRCRFLQQMQDFKQINKFNFIREVNWDCVGL